MERPKRRTTRKQKAIDVSSEEAEKVGIECPFCGETFVNAKKLRTHVKKCAKQKNIDSVEAVRCLRAISDSLGKENIELLMKQFEGQKVSVARKRKKRQIESSSDKNSSSSDEVTFIESEPRKQSKKTSSKKTSSLSSQKQIIVKPPSRNYTPEEKLTEILARNELFRILNEKS